MKPINVEDNRPIRQKLGMPEKLGSCHTAVVDGYVIEGTRSNLFFVRNGRLHTPDLTRCGIDGIMRQVLLQRYGSDAETGFYTLADLHMADEVFVSNSVIGVWPLLSLQSGGDRVEWRLGPVARDCVHYFNAVLGA